MSQRNIVLLSDGTGNSAAKVWRTNVWRVYERVDLTDDVQVAYYDDGVGSQGFLPFALLGGAFGYGLTRNVLELYKFACRNYRGPEDKIYGFGFSRGAFTIRVVAALIADQGILYADSEDELEERAVLAYRAYRRRYRTLWPRWLAPEVYARAMRDLSGKKPRNDPKDLHNVTIHFLGLWDTVAAYGAPVDEVARGISYWIWPWMLPNERLSGKIERAYHALSVDDDRTSFHPILIDEVHSPENTPHEGNAAKQVISQVWFPGAHANVGGGYPDDALAQISLDWILGEAATAGLKFKSTFQASPQTQGWPSTAADKDGRRYDPRSGLKAYYRYGPRDIAALGNGRLRGPARIHESVFQRILNRARPYAPVGIPATYDVVTRKGSLVQGPYLPLETPQEAEQRCIDQKSVWDIIIWRRLNYFITVALTLYFIIFPLFNSPTYIPKIPTESDFSKLIELVGEFFPKAVEGWFNGWARAPQHTAICLGLIIATNVISSRLARAAFRQMEQIWRKRSAAQPLKATSLKAVARKTDNAQTALRKWVLPTAAAVGCLVVFALLANRTAFHIADISGSVCISAYDAWEKEVDIKVPIVPNMTEEETQKREKLLHKRTLGGAEYFYVDDVDANDRSTNAVAFAKTAKLPPVADAPSDPAPDLFRRYNNIVHGTRKLFKLDPKVPCVSTGIWLEAGQRFFVVVETTKDFKLRVGSHSIDASKSFRSPVELSLPAMYAWATTPLRRKFTYPWFRVFARIGATTHQEDDLIYDDREGTYKINTPLRARHAGELFLYVNGPVTPVFSWTKRLYSYYEGEARVIVRTPR